MAGLSFNPDGHMIRDGRTLAEIIADEEYLDPEDPVKEKPEKEEKKFKFMSFELDMTYPRTLRGFIRILQILLLLVAFVCLIITTWPSQGIYSFYCVFLIFGALASGFLFFTIIAGSRKGGCCGLSWVKVELIYFFAFGFIIFIGACLAASNSGGNPALNAGAAFGFIACITFAMYIFWTWKDYKNPPDKDDEDEENKDSGSQNDNDSVNGANPAMLQNGTNEKRRTASMIDPPENQNGDLRIDAPLNQRTQDGVPSGYRHLQDGTRSLERPLSIISRNELIDPHFKKDQKHRRQRSGSDKDSAYSEGSIVERDRSLPTKIRRTASARGEDRLRNSTRKPRHFGERRVANGSAERRPQELSADLLNQEDGRQRKSVPSWLRAALDDEENDRPGRRLVSTMPAPGRNEFPLLHMSDEESIAYPSVSQTIGNGEHIRWNHMRGQGARDEKGHRHAAQRGRRGQFHHKNARNRGPHAAQGRGGKRFHTHGHRHFHGHGKRPIHGQHRGQVRHGGRHGRLGHGHHRAHHGVPHDRVLPDDDVFLRKMVGNDQLVHRNDRNSGGQYIGSGVSN